MKTLKSSRYKNSLVFYKLEKKFRDNSIVIGTAKTQLLFLTTFDNPYVDYEIISIPVGNGTYKIKIIGLDDKGNENSGTEGTVLVNFFPLPPVDLDYSLSGNNLTLTWNHSVTGAPDNYVVYGNGGYGNIIDRTTILATVAGSALTTTFTVADGQWRFVVEAIKNSLESKNFNILKVSVPLISIIPPKPGPSGESPLAVTGLSLENISVGKVKISFLWLFGAQAATFNVYHDDGSGTIDYTTPKFSFTRLGALIQTFTTTQLTASDVRQTFKFAVRAESADSVEESNTDEYSIEIDGKAPNNVIDLELDTVF